jgi:hypothetical protein
MQGNSLNSEVWSHISEFPEFFQKAQLHHVGLSGEAVAYTKLSKLHWLLN